MLFLGQLGFHAQRVNPGAHRVGRPFPGVFRHGREPRDLRLLEGDGFIGKGEFDGIPCRRGARGERGGTRVFQFRALDGAGLPALGGEHPRLWQRLLHADNDIPIIRTHGFLRGHQTEADHRVVPQADGTQVLGGGHGAVFAGRDRRVVAHRFVTQTGEQALIQELCFACLQQAAGHSQTGE